MIAQLVDRSFVLDRINKAEAFLGGPDIADQRGVLELLAAEDLTLADLQEAIRILAASRDADQALELESPTAESRVAWIPQDKNLSLLQSALHEFYEESRPETIEDQRDGRGALPEDVPVTTRRLVGVEEPDDARELFQRFSTTDVGWATTLFAMAKRKAAGRYPFVDRPAEPLRIGNRSRLVVFADWGSGIPRARAVSAAIRAQLDEGKQLGLEQHVLHLGDVYYSGWAREYKKNFLRHWPVTDGESDTITSWSLNANHDMYSGGKAYYTTLLGDSRFARQEGSSLFSLVNDHWKILGLDTAYDDHDLAGRQREWIDAELDGRQKGMLLSHHQLFDSDDSSKGDRLAQKLAGVLGRGAVNAWFWGHEHECTLFTPGHGNVGFARCIGHGGVPVYRPGAPKASYVEFRYQDSLDVGFERWALFGFVVLDFEDANINVRYINEKGQEHRSEVIS